MYLIATRVMLRVVINNKFEKLFQKIEIMRHSYIQTHTHVKLLMDFKFIKI